MVLNRVIPKIPDGFNILGQLSDSRLEVRFQETQYRATKKRMRFVCATTCGAYLGAIYANYLVLPHDVFAVVTAGRLITVFFGIVAFLFTFKLIKYFEALNISLLVYMCVMMSTEVLELVSGFDYFELRETPLTVMIVLMFYLFQCPRIWQPLISGGLGSLAYVVALVFFTAAPADYVCTTALTFGLVNGFGAYFYIRFGMSQRREYLVRMELKRWAETDPLTGILNRRQVLELGEREINSAKRYGHPCSLLMVDVDYFKLINDTQGHSVGDDVLMTLAERCGDALRDVDVFGRLGGEEFVIILPHSKVNHAATVADRVRKVICEMPFDTEGDQLDVTVSIGVAELAKTDQGLDDLLKRADSALYKAKEKGRNRVMIYEENA